MKRLIIIIVSFFVVSFGYAQSGNDENDGYERYRSLRISFMTEKMELTPAEAQGFWPVFNEYDRKRTEIQMTRRDEEVKIIENYDAYSDAEFKKMNDSIIDLYVQEATLMKEYNQKFLEVLPARKVVLIGKLENDFRFNMIREFREQDDD